METKDTTRSGWSRRRALNALRACWQIAALTSTTSLALAQSPAPSSAPAPSAPAPSAESNQPPAAKAPAAATAKEEAASTSAPPPATVAPAPPPAPPTSEQAPKPKPQAPASDTGTGLPVAEVQQEGAPSSPAEKAKQATAGTTADASTLDEDASAGLDDLSLVDLLQLDLRVATTKTDTTVQASPAAVIVVSREDINRYGYRSVAEVLRDVVGTYVVDDHVTPNIGVRGVPSAAYEGSGAVKVMIDGVPVTFRTTGENWLGPALVPMASIERIEIVKGPTSSLYGANAFLGVINVITRKGASKSWGEFGGGGLSTFDQKLGYRMEAAAGLVRRPFRLQLGAQYELEDRSGLNVPSSSPAPSLADTAGDSSRSQKLKSGVALARLSYQPTRKTTYSAAARYARQQTAAEFAPWLQLTNVDNANTGTWLSLQQGSLTLSSNSEFTRSFQLNTMATGFFGGTLPDDRIDTGDAVALMHRDLSYYGGQGILEGVISPSDTWRLVVAAEALAHREHLGAPDFRSRDTGEDIVSAGSAKDFETTLFNFAGRAQLTWDLIKDYLVPTGGLRFDHNSIYGNRFSGRMAVVSKVYTDLYLKTAYGTSFKAPTPFLLYGRPLATGDVIGNPNLAPQQMRSWELTADYRRKNFAEAELTVTRWDLIDRAVFRPEQINLVARNSADAAGWTVEARVKSTFSEYVGGQVGFEKVKVKRESGEVGYRGQLFGNAGAIYPDYIGRGRLWLRPSPVPVEVFAAGLYVGPRNASDSNTLEAGQRYQLPTYVTLDAGIRTIGLHFIGDRLTEFAFRGQNILDSAGVNAGFFGIDYPAIAPRVQLELRQEL